MYLYWVKQNKKEYILSDIEKKVYFPNRDSNPGRVGESHVS